MLLPRVSREDDDARNLPEETRVLVVRIRKWDKIRARTSKSMYSVLVRIRFDHEG